MRTTFVDPDGIRYRLLLVEPGQRKMLARRDGSSWLLPRVTIPRWSRTAPNLQEKIKEHFGIQAIILDELEAPTGDSLALAEVIHRRQMDIDQSFSWREIEDLATDEFQETEFRTIQGLLLDGTTGRGPFSTLGWIHEVFAWTAAQIAVSPDRFVDVRQINASSHSTLIRFGLATGPAIWFKAVADPQMSEYRITKALRDLFPDYLPTILAVHHKWQAWLMEDAGAPLDTAEHVRPRLFEEVARRFADLQKSSMSKIEHLLEQGCADLRLASLSARMPEFMAHLEEAVELPHCGDNGYSRRKNIRSLTRALLDATDQLEVCGVPDTLVHCDINTENVLIADGTCIFTDWAEAAIGNPLANFEHLKIQIAQSNNAAAIHDRMIAAYVRAWSSTLSASQIRRALAAVPPVAIAMYLDVRRDWLRPGRLRDPQFTSYARGMARQMERAVQEFHARAALIA